MKAWLLVGRWHLDVAALAVVAVLMLAVGFLTGSVLLEVCTVAVVDLALFIGYAVTGDRP